MRYLGITLYLSLVTPLTTISQIAGTKPQSGASLKGVKNLNQTLYAGFPPLRMRAGSSSMARTSSKTPSTAKPTRRKGNRISQIKGYKTSANKASGHEITSSMHHNKNFTITSLSTSFRA